MRGHQGSITAGDHPDCACVVWLEAFQHTLASVSNYSVKIQNIYFKTFQKCQ